MSEFRQDRTTGGWVIIAPKRSRRPHSSQLPETARERRPRFDPSCPFCPGNEGLLPAIIEEMPSEKAPGWRTRVVPNKYPTLQPENGGASSAALAGPVMPGYGYHEVIIETPRHDGDLTTLSGAHLDNVLRTYRHRYSELIARPAIKGVLLFRNHGAGGGASIAHPHSQIIATGITPTRLAAMTAWARSHHAQYGKCVVCQEIEIERASGQRIIEATERFIAVVPFAAASPFEQCIIPARHQASFAQTSDLELAEFGRILQRVLYRLKAALADPPYRYVIESGAAAEGDDQYGHWRLRIVPDLVHPGGFELGTGLPINPSLPEQDAKKLRRVTLPPTRDEHQ